MLSLRLLELSDKKEFMSALSEPWENHFDFVHYWESIANKSFEDYIKLAPGFLKGLHIPENHVPCIMLFAFNEDSRIVGRVSIRLSLNENLLEFGGHIGYGVCPQFRKRGYATEILKLSLNYIKLNLAGMDRVLLTCDETNIASNKTILRNFGILENKVHSENRVTNRYWIDL